MADEPVMIIVATFADLAGASRGLATLAPALGREALHQAAVVGMGADGKVRFVETHDKSTGQGAVLGGAAGAIGGLLGSMLGPISLLGAPIGAALGALVARMKDSGYDDDELKGLGADLQNGASAVIANVDASQVEKAQRLLAELSPQKVVVREVDAALSSVLDAEATAAIEAAPATP